MRSIVRKCPHVGAISYPPIPRGNWRRSCLKDVNGEHDLHHDDDQHVHRWNPNIPLDFPPSLTKDHHIQATQSMGHGKPASP
jgi:hypothetical protein